MEKSVPEAGEPAKPNHLRHDPGQPSPPRAPATAPTASATAPPSPTSTAAPHIDLAQLADILEPPQQDLPRRPRPPTCPRQRDDHGTRTRTNHHAQRRGASVPTRARAEPDLIGAVYVEAPASGGQGVGGGWGMTKVPPPCPTRDVNGDGGAWMGAGGVGHWMPRTAWGGTAQSRPGARLDGDGWSRGGLVEDWERRCRLGMMADGNEQGRTCS